MDTRLLFRHDYLLRLTTALLCTVLLNAVSYAESGITAAKPALTVTVAQPQTQILTAKTSANGNIMPWQEAIIGNETNNLRLTAVSADVGDTVKRGQVLATFAAETLQAQLAELQAQVVAAETSLAEARANVERAQQLNHSQALSEQQHKQYLFAEQSAKANLLARQAAVRTQQLRIQQTSIIAPDDGIIASRTATVGAVLPAGQELFRLIRQARLEWHAELTASELVHIKLGASVQLHTPDGETLIGKVRLIAPTVNQQTRLGLVYVDIPRTNLFKAGMFIAGEFIQGSLSALTVAQQAVVVKDGFQYVFRLNPDQHVQQIKVQTGRRTGESVEIISGIDAKTTLVVKGAGFLNDGDLVKVVPESTSNTTTQP